MGMSHLERGMTAIAGSDLTFFAGPRPSSLVDAAEAALHLRMPPTYRRFVSELGAGSVGGSEFYGVTSDKFANGSVPNGIWLTLKYRETAGLSRYSIIVGETGSGQYYVLDTSQRDDDDESPVVLWAPGFPETGSPEVVAPDFGSFFLNSILEEFGSQ